MDAECASKSATYAVELQLKWPFNRNAFKLLSAIDGGVPEDYRKFALRARPFEKGSIGYFKANLFPVPCNSVQAWDDSSATKTGFATKHAYRSWLRENRFRVLSQWIARCQPLLVIGAGLTHSKDFFAITGTTEEPRVHSTTMNGHSKRLYIAASGTVPVAVIPHLSGGAHSLNSNEAIAWAAARIRTELKI